MNRRDFLKAGALVAAAGAIKLKMPGGKLLAAEAENAQNTPGAHDVVAIRNGDAVTMFRKGIEAFGGMTALVKPGQYVVIKPNMAWDRTPEEGANTTPELVAEIVRQVLAAGASKVEVFDHTCNEWSSCYRNSGIEKAASEAGAAVVNAHLESNYREEERPQAVRMRRAKIHKSIMECDVFINVPILKNHGGAQMTAAMKNFMGLVWDRRFMHGNNLPQCIADSVLYRMPDLNVVDAYRVMVSNGPRGVSANDVRLRKYMLLSRDIVAIDAVASQLIGYKLEQVPYINLAEKLGHGKIKPDNIIRLEA